MNKKVKNRAKSKSKEEVVKELKAKIIKRPTNLNLSTVTSARCN